MLAMIAQIVGSLAETPALDNERIALIERLIRYASHAAEKITKQFLIKATHTIRMNGNGLTKLLIPTMSKPSLKHVKIDGVTVTGASVSDSGIVYYKHTFPEGFQNIEIQFECGYESTVSGDNIRETPPDLNEAIIAETISRYRMYQEINIPTAEGAQAGEDTRVFLNKEAEALLEFYKRWV